MAVGRTNKMEKEGKPTPPKEGTQRRKEENYVHVSRIREII